MTPRLVDLREPPVVGKFYFVPVVRSYPWSGVVLDWPVIGPLHGDAEFFSFPHAHYHLDARFFTKRQDRITGKRSHWSSKKENDWLSAVGSKPLFHSDRPLPKGRPHLARRMCRRESYGYAFSHEQQVKSLNAHYGAPAEPIRLADGRLLCPHRKVDQSQFPCDGEGVVTCPLHGLKVRIGATA